VIIGITGFKRSGKSTVAEILADDFGFSIVALADKLRSVLLGANPYVVGNTVRLSEIVRHHGWEVAKDLFPEVRRLMQDLATEGVRDNLGPDTWLDAWQNSLPFDTVTEETIGGEMMHQHHIYRNTATPDVRFLNEIHRIKSINGVIWRVERPTIVSTDRHRSETEFMMIEPDMVIANDGTFDDLRRTVRAAMSKHNIFVSYM